MAACRQSRAVPRLWVHARKCMRLRGAVRDLRGRRRRHTGRGPALRCGRVQGRRLPHRRHAQPLRLRMATGRIRRARLLRGQERAIPNTRVKWPARVAATAGARGDDAGNAVRRLRLGAAGVLGVVLVPGGESLGPDRPTAPGDSTPPRPGALPGGGAPTAAGATALRHGRRPGHRDGAPDCRGDNATTFRVGGGAPHRARRAQRNGRGPTGGTATSGGDASVTSRLVGRTCRGQCTPHRFAGHGAPGRGAARRDDRSPERGGATSQGKAAGDSTDAVAAPAAARATAASAAAAATTDTFADAVDPPATPVGAPAAPATTATFTVATVAAAAPAPAPSPLATTAASSPFAAAAATDATTAIATAAATAATAPASAAIPAAATVTAVDTTIVTTPKVVAATLSPAPADPALDVCATIAIPTAAATSAPITAAPATNAFAATAPSATTPIAAAPTVPISNTAATAVSASAGPAFAASASPTAATPATTAPARAAAAAAAAFEDASEPPAVDRHRTDDAAGGSGVLSAAVPAPYGSHDTAPSTSGGGGSGQAPHTPAPPPTVDAGGVAGPMPLRPAAAGNRPTAAALGHRDPHRAAGTGQLANPLRGAGARRVRVPAGHGRQLGSTRRDSGVPGELRRRKLRRRPGRVRRHGAHHRHQWLERRPRAVPRGSVLRRGVGPRTGRLGNQRHRPPRDH